MRKFTFTQLSIFLTLFIMAFASCQKKDPLSATTSLSSLSTKTQEDLLSSQQNWNKNAGSVATLVSFKATGTVSNESQRSAIIAALASDNSYLAYGNVLDLSSLQLLTVKDLSQSNPSARDSVIKYASDRIAVGNKIVTIEWQKGQTVFTTQCIVGDAGIVWDNVLTNVIMLNTTPQVQQTSDSSKAAGGKIIGEATIQPDYIAAWYSNTLTWTANWIWGSHRGDMGCTITIYCYSNAQVYSTDHSDWATMELGSAKSDSKVLVNSGSYGKIQYALGIATPFASVEFNNSNWKVSVSGIGSSMVANGSTTLTPWNVK